jgi:hypothetical protein
MVIILRFIQLPTIVIRGNFCGYFTAGKLLGCISVWYKRNYPVFFLPKILRAVRLMVVVFFL